MTYALVKFTVDLFAPGAILSTTLTTWLSVWNGFHSRRILWPVKPYYELMDVQHDGSKALEDFFHIRVSSIMDGYDGVTDGALDRILTDKTVGEVFDMPRIVGVALELAEPYQFNITRAGWVDLFEVHDETVVFIRPASIQEIAARLIQSKHGSPNANLSAF